MLISENSCSFFSVNYFPPVPLTYCLFPCFCPHPSVNDMHSDYCLFTPHGHLHHHHHYQTKTRLTNLQDQQRGVGQSIANLNSQVNGEFASFPSAAGEADQFSNLATVSMHVTLKIRYWPQTTFFK